MNLASRNIVIEIVTIFIQMNIKSNILIHNHLNPTKYNVQVLTTINSNKFILSRPYVVQKKLCDVIMPHNGSNLEEMYINITLCYFPPFDSIGMRLLIHDEQSYHSLP